MTRIQAASLMLLAVPVVWALLWWGWRSRARRQSDVPDLPARPDQTGETVLGPVEAVYVTTTTAGDWLDRVVRHGLGVRSNATVTVTTAGVDVRRHGAPDVWIGRDRLSGVRRERGMAGKFADKEGVVVLTWQLGDLAVDTGLRPRHRTDREALTSAVETLVEATP